MDPYLRKNALKVELQGGEEVDFFGSDHTVWDEVFAVFSHLKCNLGRGHSIKIINTSTRKIKKKKRRGFVFARLGKKNRWENLRHSKVSVNRAALGFNNANSTGSWLTKSFDPTTLSSPITFSCSFSPIQPSSRWTEIDEEELIDFYTMIWMYLVCACYTSNTADVLRGEEKKMPSPSQWPIDHWATSLTNYCILFSFWALVEATRSLGNLIPYPSIQLYRDFHDHVPVECTIAMRSMKRDKWGEEKRESMRHARESTAGSSSFFLWLFLFNIGNVPRLGVLAHTLAMGWNFTSVNLISSTLLPSFRFLRTPLLSPLLLAASHSRWYIQCKVSSRSWLFLMRNRERRGNRVLSVLT